MIGFHVDMNMAQFRRDYLEKWLKKLARIGYDTILWEVEDNIKWETCPECASPDAFAKDEFREILKFSRSLGLEPIPLLQTIGHCQYVLRNEKYQHLCEVPGNFWQYCPRHPELLPFLKKWVAEYLDLFGEVRYFHLGADEAAHLGKCDKCREFVQAHSVSELYIEHVNAVSAGVLERGVTPVIWADMVLTHPEALEKLSRKITLFDWYYKTYRGVGGVHVWGETQKAITKAHEIPAEIRKKYDRHLYPFSDELSREPDPFYSASFLAEQGFEVVGCPASSCSGDNVFSPLHWLHVVNTFDWFRKDVSAKLKGTLVTSWTVRIVPWELQLSAIDVPGFLRKDPDRTLESFAEHFLRSRFGTQDAGFWRAAGLLAKDCLFTGSATLGFNKSCLPPDDGFFGRNMGRITGEGRLDSEIAKCQTCLAGYREALQILDGFSRKATKGQEYLKVWDWAARNLINRARASALILDAVKNPAESPARTAEAAEVLKELRELRKETRRLYLRMQKPYRTDQIVVFIYGLVEKELARLAGK